MKIEFHCADCDYFTEDPDMAEEHESEWGHRCEEREVKPLMEE